MRPVHPACVAGAALAALLLAAGCVARDELRRDGADDPAGTTASSAPPRQPVTPAPRSTALAAPGPVLRGALLDDADVAAEGVRRVAVRGPAVPAVQGRLPQCLTGALEGAEPATGKVAAAWRYPTGSVLAQLVAGYPQATAQRLLREVAGCGRQLNAPGAATDPVAANWCEPNSPGTVSCTALMTAGDRVSLVTVRASGPARAAQAVNRLAPLAERKLRSD